MKSHPDPGSTHHARVLRQRLSALRAQIEAALLRINPNAHAQLLAQVHSVDDEAFIGALLEVTLAEVSRELSEARDIEAALQRLRSQTFGVCVECAAPIAAARLEAYPTAKRCLACQRRYEQTHTSAPAPGP